MQSVYYVGMDVHKDSVRMTILKDTEKTTVYEATFPNDIARTVKAVGKYTTKGRVVAGCEAGCMGYTLQRSLATAQIYCRVIAANKVPRLGERKDQDRRSRRGIDRAGMARQERRSVHA